MDKLIRKEIQKTWDRDAILTLLDRNPTAVYRALLLIYNKQTYNEQRIERTEEHNKIGFNACDAKVLTDIAKRCKSYGRFASDRQMQFVKKRISKYWKQLQEEIVNRELKNQMT